MELYDTKFDSEKHLCGLLDDEKGLFTSSFSLGVFYFKLLPSLNKVMMMMMMFVFHSNILDFCFISGKVL